ncbi:uncharacterized protein L969DRAFT_85702 [Mixia osmundae IAM 14324]|uniref:uncharacterized protein n=1 Tax=Mixia osmundae (strain CBS 9802 / IAM 14324 / JCM 22182 / KY 12970) TaxID=764103 RepID=UPI0004A556CA|nr:uncharacterized protein L969DRAFT_85702 [Mixia osmundae IAM 14324]KEI40527.1 hypothetical protein L969DRAFT_85702 [Mixia osmundae IAM 14324]
MASRQFSRDLVPALLRNTFDRADPMSAAQITPMGITPKSTKAYLDWYKAQLASGSAMWKAVRPGTNDIVGMLSLCKVQRDENGKYIGGPPRWADPNEPVYNDPWYLPDFNNTFIREMMKFTIPAEEALMKGRRYIVGINLFVIKDLQNAGVGRQLCDKALDFSKKEGLPIFCIASTGGKKLYLKLGFTESESFVLDPSKPDQSFSAMILQAD